MLGGGPSLGPSGGWGGTWPHCGVTPMVPPARHLPGQLVGGGAKGSKQVLCQLWRLGGRSAGSQQRPLLGKASPELPGVPEGAGPPCVLLCDSCAWGLHACVGSWSHAERGPGALGCDFALFESGCPAPPCVGGEGHPPHCPPRWGHKPLAFPLLGAGVGPVLPPLWVSRLGDCQVTAADTALGIRARLRAPRPRTPPPYMLFPTPPACPHGAPSGPFTSLFLQMLVLIHLR